MQLPKNPLITDEVEATQNGEKKILRGFLDRLLGEFALGRRVVRGEAYVFTCDESESLWLAEDDVCKIRGNEFRISEIIRDGHGLCKIVFEREAY